MKRRTTRGCVLGTILLCAHGCTSESSGDPASTSASDDANDDDDANGANSTRAVEPEPGSDDNGPTNDEPLATGGVSGSNPPDEPTLAEPEPMPSGTSRAQACVLYAEAYCARLSQCAGATPEGIPEQCARSSVVCPDLSFSDGSTRTPEGLIACIEDIAAFDCDSWNLGYVPECVSPGTRQPGEPCIFPSQCATLVCSGSSEACGACLAFAAAEDDCRDTTLFTCAPGTGCNPESGLCEALTLPDPVGPESNEPQGDPTADMRGEPCERDSDCGAYESCLTDRETPVCGRDPILGEDCDEARNCADDSYCELEGLTCLELPEIGEACGVDGWTGLASWCEPGTICQRSSDRVGTCVALPEEGAPCVIVEFAEEGPVGYCAAGLVCSELTVCVPEPPPPPEVVTVPIGGSCAEPHQMCHPASVCTDGLCEPLESQGLFDAVCGSVE